MPSRAPLRRACPLHESVPWPAICLRAAPSFVASIYLPRRTCDTLRLGSFSLRRLLDLLLVSSPADRPPARIRQNIPPIFISNTRGRASPCTAWQSASATKTSAHTCRRRCPVSICPLHHGRRCLPKMERHKWRALHHVLKRMGQDRRVPRRPCAR
jgi:hypothetical protein